MLRPIIASTMLGAVVGSALAAGVLLARAEDPSSTVSIDNFTFSPKELKVKAGTTVTWTNHDDIAHGIASSNNAFAKSKVIDTDDSYSFKFTAPGTLCWEAWGGLTGSQDRVSRARGALFP